MAGLNLKWPAVAMAFLAEPPAGVPRIERPLAASCAYWKHASEGHSFYTTAEDHYTCTIGAFTHGVAVPADKKPEFDSVLNTMITLQYLRSEEVPEIPHRTEVFSVAAYAPVDQAPFRPDVVIVRGNARQLMLVSEAARSAGIFDAGAAAMGRPTCAMIPQVIASSTGVSSFGCIGNRVYTELADDELYLAIPGPGFAKTMAQLGIILTANAELEKFHQQRAATSAQS